MAAQELTIGSLARHTGTNVQTIRYYEQIGLMPTPLRTEGNQRRYDDEHRRRLGFIRNARDLGFSIDTISILLGLAGDPDRSCTKVMAIAEENLVAVQQRLARLRALEKSLKAMITSCDRGDVGGCTIIEALSDQK